jgi:uncharacterized protein YjbI with pentapeptide repeats
MQSNEVTPDFFIYPNVDLQQGNQDFSLAANFSKKQLKDRWKTSAGQNILSRWKASKFDRKVLDSFVGKFYGHTDIRGIDLTGEDLSRADLSQVDLFAATLENTNFKYANLTDSYLSETNIKGACFDGALMKETFLDNVVFDKKTSFLGVNLSVINFNLATMLQESAIAQARINSLENKYPILANILRVTCNYGQSFPRFFLTCFITILVFSFAYLVIPYSLTKPGLPSANVNFFDSFYCSLMTFVGASCSLQPGSTLGKILVMIESIAGYLLTGLLVAILVRRTIGD